MIEDATDLTTEILALERGALTRWGKGDPSGYLEISDETVSYFDPMRAERIDSLAALERYYSPLRGRIQINRDEIVNPRLQQFGDIVILTFNFISHGSEGQMHWHCTEVYRLLADSWRIVHTHWSTLQRR